MRFFHSIRTQTHARIGLCISAATIINIYSEARHRTLCVYICSPCYLAEKSLWSHTHAPNNVCLGDENIRVIRDCVRCSTWDEDSRMRFLYRIGKSARLGYVPRTLARPALFTQSEGAVRGKSGGGDVCTCNILFIYTTHGINVV